MRILIRGGKPRVDVVVVIPAIEVNTGNQRVAPLHLTHDRIKRRHAMDLVPVLPSRRRCARVKKRAAAIVGRAVGHATVDGFNRYRRGNHGHRQCLRHQIAIAIGQRRYLLKTSIDHPRLQPGCAAQLCQRSLPQIGSLLVTNFGVTEQVDGNQRRLHQHQRYQRTANKGAPDPLLQSDVPISTHYCYPRANDARRLFDINIISRRQFRAPPQTVAIGRTSRQLGPADMKKPAPESGAGFSVAARLSSCWHACGRSRSAASCAGESTSASLRPARRHR